MWSDKENGKKVAFVKEEEEDKCKWNRVKITEGGLKKFIRSNNINYLKVKKIIIKVLIYMLVWIKIAPWACEQW